MATGQSFQDVAEFIGHDGSERAFSDYEIFRYLAHCGVVPAGGASFGAPDGPVPGAYARQENMLIALPLAVAKVLRELAAKDGVTVGEFVAGMAVVAASRHGLDLPDGQPVVIPESKACALGISGALMEGFASMATQMPLDTPAIISVMTGLEKAEGHAVYWDGQQILDPSPNVGESPQLKDYVIHRWLPIMRLSTPPPIAGQGVKQDQGPERRTGDEEAAGPS
jgi:hypothetical protein